MANQRFDVILVGGGVMGCATAYYLLKADSKLKVAVIEKDLTYSKASTPLSDGNMRVQFNIKENIEISQYGLEVLEHFAEEMAVGDNKPDVAFRQQGNLFLSDQAGEAVAKNGLALQQQLGCQVEWLTSEMAEQMGCFSVSYHWKRLKPFLLAVNIMWITFRKGPVFILCLVINFIYSSIKI